MTKKVYELDDFDVIRIGPHRRRGLIIGVNKRPYIPLQQQLDIVFDDGTYLDFTLMLMSAEDIITED